MLSIMCFKTFLNLQTGVEELAQVETGTRQRRNQGKNEVIVEDDKEADEEEIFKWSKGLTWEYFL